MALSARSRGFLGGLVVGLCWVLTPVSSATSAAPGLPQPATILRRADLVRNPFLGTALDIGLSVVSRTSGRELRGARFTMLTQRNDRTLILMPQPDRAAPGALLIAEDTYWLLLPHAERPVELALRHVVAGDLSHAGFLRVNLWVRYEAHHDGEEKIGDEPCWRLELEPRSEPAPFKRVRYWVAQRGFLPLRIEFYGEAGELLKTAHFTRYQATGAGQRPARIEIEDTRRPVERAILTLGTPRGVNTSSLAFDLADLAALRGAARSLAMASDAPASGRQLVEALVASARVRGRMRVGPIPQHGLH